MENQTTSNELPAKNIVSFYKLFEVLEQLAESDDEHDSDHADKMLKYLEDFPELRTGFDDLSLFEKYKEPIDRLSKMVFPDALLDNEIKGLCPPFQFSPFKVSRRFQRILDNAGNDFKLEMASVDNDTMYKIVCTYILSSVYGFPADISRPFVLEIPNVEEGKSKFYRLAFNADLMELERTERSPEITQQDYIELINNFDNTDLWRSKFPPNSYLMKGVGIMNLMDVTFDHSVNLVTANLLNKNNDSLDLIQSNIRSIMGVKELKIGFVMLDDQNLRLPPEHKMDSFILKGCEEASCDDLFCSYGQDELINKKEPFVIPDVDQYNELAKNKLGKSLVSQNIKSYIILPLEYNEEIIGFMELASEEKYVLNSVTKMKLDDLIPILSMAAGRFKEEGENRVEALIQKECTTIHSSVKWRFEEEALKYMYEEENGGHPQFNDIVFRDIYPLYGQMDIKGSSERRNNAVISDLTAQLSSVLTVLKEASRLEKMPLYEELIYRIERHIPELNKGLTAGSEYEIMAFLKKEVNPVFDHIKTLNRDLKGLVEDYLASLEPESEVLYDARKKFDRSITKANSLMAAFVDKKQAEAQRMFPHYFERYKTDGLEYNMYIGDSIAQAKSFDPLFLRNLRVWQLIMMCQLENEFKHLQKDLLTPLEAASLILVYNTPLSIHFRMDEKRFDVEGAYNARYEIVKKRIDKSLIKGTNERLTVPGKIAIVYTSEEDKVEYLKYIEYIESKGYLKKGSTEELLLEDLQGITGLKALRVTLSYSDEASLEDGISYDELIQSIEK